MSDRPSIDQPLRELLEAIIAAAPAQLGSLDPSRILIIAAAARKDAHASIRPLSFGGRPPIYRSEDGRHHKPRVVMNGREMLFEIALRPRFFLDTTSRERVSILTHELYHIEPGFDGRLAESRRHARTDRGELDREVEVLVSAWREAGERGLHAVRGPAEGTLSAWRERPPTRLLDPERERRLYTEADLYPAVVSFSA